MNMKHPASIRYYLAKTEPSVYSIEDLKRDKKTVWDGVKNPQAVARYQGHAAGRSSLHLPQRRSVGDCRLGRWYCRPGRPDPKNPKSAVVDLEFLLQLDSPVTLGGSQTDQRMFDDWALVRQGRLSTMRVPEKFVDWIREKFPQAAI